MNSDISLLVDEESENKGNEFADPMETELVLDDSQRESVEIPENIQVGPVSVYMAWESVNDDAVKDYDFTRLTFEKTYMLLTAETKIWNSELLRALITRRCPVNMPHNNVPVNAAANAPAVPPTRRMLVEAYCAHARAMKRVETTAKDLEIRNKRSTLQLKLLANLDSRLVCKNTYISVSSFIEQVIQFKQQHRVDAAIFLQYIVTPVRLDPGIYHSWLTADPVLYPRTFDVFMQYLYKQIVKERLVTDHKNQLLAMMQGSQHMNVFIDAVNNKYRLFLKELQVATKYLPTVTVVQSCKAPGIASMGLH